MSKSVSAITKGVAKPRVWGKPCQNKPLPQPWFGLDTERDSRTSDFVCGWLIDRSNNARSFTGFHDLPDGTYWIYNLNYDIEGMLRDTGNDAIWLARADGVRFKLGDARCIYYHGKRFEYRTKDQNLVFVDASPFWNRIPLSKLGAKEGVDASQLNGQWYANYAEYRATVDSYCRQDARITLYNVLHLARKLRQMGVEIASTPGGTARRFLSRLGPFSPVLWKTHKAFLRSYAGGRFELTKRGVIPDAHQYDLVSAYPWALTQCPWPTQNARFAHTRRLHENALYGSYEITYALPTNTYLGFAPRWRNHVRVFPRAGEKVWVTKPELEWLQAHDYPHMIHDGIEIFDEDATMAFDGPIRELFADKQVCKTKAEAAGPKTILNSQYGVMIHLLPSPQAWQPIDNVEKPETWFGDYALQTMDERLRAGPCFAPAIAGHLTSLVRLRILDAARSMLDAYVGGHTDSALSLGPWKGVTLGKDLGDWDLETKVPIGYTIKTGMYALGNTIKMRGITKRGKAEDLWAPTHTRNTRIGIKSATDFDTLNVIKKIRVANNLDIEHKRQWEKPLEVKHIERGEYIESKPW